MTVRVAPGAAGTAASRARAEHAQEQQDRELELLRQHAANWRNGLVGLVGLITGAGLIKGRESIVGIVPGGQVAVGTLLLAAVVAGVAGTLLSLRAAYGFPRSREVDATWRDVRRNQHARARAAARDLRAAVVLAVVTLALLVGAVAVTWYAPRAPLAFVEVTDDDGVVTCGTLQGAGDGAVVLAVHGAERRISVQDVGALRLRSDCPP
ncbi:hypothetical protein [uncultured Cellulomonas sp.]|uniref:hypothetical protein n=1 Tax=uncultured Cellulomonas sp. TaxID=189682 RepID=UPI00260CF84A|nr:hypothetical protein [uncultured Cellulomonas sp.]